MLSSIPDTLTRLPSQHDLFLTWNVSSPSHFVPYVSILCPTYNHADLVSDAISGFLSQVCTYPFEIIFRDDASTDGTADILRALQCRYPDIVRLIINDSNDFHLGIWKSFFDLYDAARGAIIAFCEGDDYWRDPRKLQVQVDLLRENGFISFSFTNCQDLLVNGRLVDGSFHSLSSSYTPSDVLRGKVLPMCTIAFRKNDLTLDPHMRSSPCLDVFIQSSLAALGPSVNARLDIPCVYRVHSNGVWSGAPSELRFRMIVTTLASLMSFFYSTGNPYAAWLTLLRLLDYIPSEAMRSGPSDFIAVSSVGLSSLLPEKLRDNDSPAKGVSLVRVLRLLVLQRLRVAVTNLRLRLSVVTIRLLLPNLKIVYAPKR